MFDRPLSRAHHSAVGVALFGISLLLLAATSPSARGDGEFDYCWGKVLPGSGSDKTCSSYPTGGYIDAVYGSGDNHSVCVGAHVGTTIVGSKMCSSGPGQGVYNSSPEGKYFSLGFVENNAAGNNKVYGHAWWVDPPKPPPTPDYRYMLGTSYGNNIGNWSTVLDGMSRPTRVAVGDITGDGKADIVAVEKQSNGQYRYMLGTSSGGGISNWSYMLTGMSYPEKIALGDFTGDGKDDIIAVESAGSGTYRYMLGVGASGGVSSWTSLLTGMSRPTFLSLGDVTGDGKDDLVAVENEAGSGTYRYMLGKSLGTGVSWGFTSLTKMSGPWQMDVGDFTGDGKADVVAVEHVSGSTFRYMRGTSNGSDFSSWGQLMGGMGTAYHMRLADVNGEGKTDVVSVESETGTTYRYMFGLSTGSIVWPWGYALTGLSAQDFMAVGDFTGDGKADVIGVEAY